MKTKPITIFARTLAYPFVLAIILINYNIHAVRNSLLFLWYGGEWITYAKNQKKTMQDIYKHLTEKPNNP